MLRLLRCGRWVLPICALVVAGCEPPGEPQTAAASAYVTADGWFFRGTPNSWGTTAMTAVTATTFSTCQTFANVANPRFKIDHFADWAESYPPNDRPVSDGSYQIGFDAATKSITVQSVASCSGAADTWQFRGTPNGWGTTAMTPVAGTTRHSIVVDFAKQDPAPRFKIDHHGDWTEAYPAQDFVVADCTEYQIVFDAQTKQITATAQGAITTGACAPLPPPPPPPPGADFREQTIYFVMTARFFDGDPSKPSERGLAVLTYIQWLGSWLESYPYYEDYQPVETMEAAP